MLDALLGWDEKFTFLVVCLMHCFGGMSDTSYFDGISDALYFDGMSDAAYFGDISDAHFFCWYVRCTFMMGCDIHHFGGMSDTPFISMSDAHYIQALYFFFIQIFKIY